MSCPLYFKNPVLCPMPRIISLVPAATEIIIDTDLQNFLVAVCHEDIFGANPLSNKYESVQHLPVVTRPRFDPIGMSQDEISAYYRASSVVQNLESTYSFQPEPLDIEFQKNFSLVRNQICSFYEVDVEKVISLEPDLILTQMDLSKNIPIEDMDVVLALRKLCHNDDLRLVFMNPQSINEIYHTARSICKAAGDEIPAKELIAKISATLQNFKRTIFKRSKVAIVQWLSPLYLTSGWVSELQSILNTDPWKVVPNGPSLNCDWKDLNSTEGPEVIIFALCGCSIEEAKREIVQSNKQEKFLVPGKLYFVCDARRKFSFATPRSLLDTAQVIAEIATWQSPSGKVNHHYSRSECFISLEMGDVALTSSRSGFTP